MKEERETVKQESRDKTRCCSRDSNKLWLQTTGWFIRGDTWALNKRVADKTPCCCRDTNSGYKQQVDLFVATRGFLCKKEERETVKQESRDKKRCCSIDSNKLWLQTTTVTNYGLTYSWRHVGSCAMKEERETVKQESRDKTRCCSRDSNKLWLQTTG
ncbi:hypothetical protein J6590_057479 [Homalodisca vitripennis]|nr:hypothetical protein J6590_057479 [Homalodisca vitripennis]